MIKWPIKLGINQSNVSIWSLKQNYKHVMTNDAFFLRRNNKRPISQNIYTQLCVWNETY